MRLIATATKKGKYIRKPYNSTCKTLSLKFEYTFLSKRQPAQKELFFSIRLQFLSTFIERNENHWSTTCALRVNFKPKVRMYQCLFYVWYDMIWYELLGLSPSLLGGRNSLEYQRISRVRAPKASMEYPWVQTSLIKSTGWDMLQVPKSSTIDQT